MMNWLCTGVSVQGHGHVRQGMPCQDAQGWAQVNDTLILACADGAGSAAHAEWGSTLAVDKVVAHMISHAVGWRMAKDPEDHQAYLLGTLKGAFQSARDALTTLAAREQVALRDLATTLLLAVVSDGYTAAAQVGDGAIVCSVGGHEGIKALTTPFQGQYINEAVFITQENYTDYLQLQAIEGSARHLALFSDGFEPVAIKYATGEPNPVLFEGLFQFMNDTSSQEVRTEAVTRLLTGKRIAERSDDDKTLVLATRCNEFNEGCPS
ncbi:MAG TPA: protein phosphatase 2C domain-containing protein [Gammaproteobacteria bacterium]|nr:protein phosphatase 2C domain-containing protein [Gammaproteobacteria bacterium]